MDTIDKIDCEILQVLQNNARIQNKELATKVGIAESTCLQRVRRLRERGVLTGYRATVDPRRLGVGLQAMVAVQLRSHSRATVQRFQQSVLSRAEVVACYHLGGRTDFLVHVAVRDSAHLRDLLLSTLTERDEVQQVETSIIYEQNHTEAWPIYPSARTGEHT